MKLKLKKRKGGNSVVSAMPEDDYMHCCRYCHYYEEGCCYNKEVRSTYIDLDFDAWYADASENAVVQDAIEEELQGDKLKSALFNDITNAALRHCKMSHKKLEEFKDALSDIYDIFVNDSLPVLDGRIGRALKGYYEIGDNRDSVGVEIPSPREHYCSLWE